MATRVFRSRAMGTAAYLEQVSVWREHRDGPIVTRHDGSGSFRSRPASDLQTPATRTLAAGGRTRGRDRSAGRVTRASSTAAGRACECRALGGGCVLNDASFQRETRRNSHTARQDWSRACDVAHSRVAAEVISRRRCAFVSSVYRYICSRQTNRVRDVYASLATSLPISVPPASTSSSPPPRLPPRSSTPTRALDARPPTPSPPFSPNADERFASRRFSPFPKPRVSLFASDVRDLTIGPRRAWRGPAFFPPARR